MTLSYIETTERIGEQTEVAVSAAYRRAPTEVQHRSFVRQQPLVEVGCVRFVVQDRTHLGCDWQRETVERRRPPGFDARLHDQLVLAPSIVLAVHRRVCQRQGDAPREDLGVLLYLCPNQWLEFGDPPLVEPQLVQLLRERSSAVVAVGAFEKNVLSSAER